MIIRLKEGDEEREGENESWNENNGQRQQVPSWLCKTVYFLSGTYRTCI